MLTFDNLSPEQKKLIAVWWEENDPQDHLECTDNYRYAIAGNVEQEKAYDEARNHGCCGFVDVEIKLSNGDILLYGFNYGH